MRSVTIFCMVAISLIIVATCVAWGGVWGGKNFGADNFGAAKWGSGGVAVDTYWNSTYTATGDWDTAYGTDWNEAYNTEIP